MFHVKSICPRSCLKIAESEDQLNRRFIGIVALLPVFFTLFDWILRTFNKEFASVAGGENSQFRNWNSGITIAGNLVLWFLATKVKRINSQVIAHLWAALGCAILFTLSARTGGMSSYAGQWYTMILMALGLMLPGYAAYYWIAFCVFQAVVLLLIYTPTQQGSLVHSIGFIELEIMITLVIWNYHRFRGMYYSLIEKQRTNQEVLLRVISHDIRNPMQVIVSAADRLSKPNVDVAHAGEQILKATKTVLGIVDHAREQIRFASSEISLHAAVTDLAPVVQRAVHGVEELAAQKGVVIEVKMHCTEGAFALVDEQRLHDQVLENLLINAIKFSPPKGKIRISLSCLPQSVLIMVQDRGIGIPQNLIPQLFNFVPTSKRRGTSGEVGSGFGLSITKAYVTAMKGTIRVRSRDSKDRERSSGTIVLVKFPVARTSRLENRS